VNLKKFYIESNLLIRPFLNWKRSRGAQGKPPHQQLSMTFAGMRMSWSAIP